MQTTKDNDKQVKSDRDELKSDRDELKTRCLKCRKDLSNDDDLKRSYFCSLVCKKKYDDMFVSVQIINNFDN